MELKPGYKQTEVGVIPENWETRTIGQVFHLINGCAFKPEDWKEQGTPIIRIQNLNDPAAPFNYSNAPVEARHRVEPGDLLFAWSGTTGTSFGARVWRGPSGVLNQHIFKVITDPRQLAPEFSLVVLERVQEDIEKKAHGFKASFVHVRRPDLIKVSLPVPPIREQLAIAAALSDVNALIGALDQLIAKKRDLKQAAIQQLITGQLRLPGFHGEWEVRRFGDVAAPRKDRVDPRTSVVQEFCVELEHIDQGTGRLLGSTNAEVQSSLKSIFLTGDVLFGKLRAYPTIEIRSPREVLADE